MYPCLLQYATQVGKKYSVIYTTKLGKKLPKGLPIKSTTYNNYVIYTLILGNFLPNWHDS